METARKYGDRVSVVLSALVLYITISLTKPTNATLFCRPHISNGYFRYHMYLYPYDPFRLHCTLQYLLKYTTGMEKNRMINLMEGQVGIMHEADDGLHDPAGVTTR